MWRHAFKNIATQWKKGAKKNKVALPVMYTVTDNTPHHLSPHTTTTTTTTLADHTISLTLIQHDVDTGVSSCFPQFTYTLLLHLDSLYYTHNHSEQVTFTTNCARWLPDWLLGIFLRFLLHALRNPPQSYSLSPHLSPLSIVCFRSVYVLSVWTSSFVLFRMTSEIQQQQQQLDTPMAPEAATGVTIRRKRHLVGRSGTRCQ